MASDQGNLKENLIQPLKHRSKRERDWSNKRLRVGAGIKKAAQEEPKIATKDRQPEQWRNSIKTRTPCMWRHRRKIWRRPEWLGNGKRKKKERERLKQEKPDGWWRQKHACTAPSSCFRERNNEYGQRNGSKGVQWNTACSVIHVSPAGHLFASSGKVIMILYPLLKPPPPSICSMKKVVIKESPQTEDIIPKIDAWSSVRSIGQFQVCPTVCLLLFVFLALNILCRLYFVSKTVNFGFVRL